jgi:hypothetical protein
MNTMFGWFAERSEPKRPMEAKVLARAKRITGERIKRVMDKRLGYKGVLVLESIKCT